MSILTDLTRIWLTKSFKPFLFKDEYDNILPYENVKNLGLYVHIPFCESICGFCPYCKEKYDKNKCGEYIDALIKEIQLAGIRNKSRKKVTTLYFGGGTPVLAVSRLREITEALNKYFIIEEGIGIELHPNNVTVENLLELKSCGITKISIGIQSFQDKFLKILGRNRNNYKTMFDALKAVPFETVSMDFIFALPEQNFSDLKADIETAFSNGANHIAVYPFINFSFTSSKIPSMKNKEKRKLLDSITEYCEKKGYFRDSVWTFSNNKNAKYSSMTRDNFLGFGVSATTLLEKQFKINTFSVEEYIGRIKKSNLPTSLTIRFTKKQRMIYYLFWTAYSTKIDKNRFEEFFGEALEKNYGFELWLAVLFGFAVKNTDVYEMTYKGAFYYHYYENFYTLSYIDKMWGIMRSEAFPKKISF